LRMDDFMLVIMSSAQVSGLRKFAGQNKEVALDSTHGTNSYNFQLTTLLVIDEHGEGFPVAFCFSNKVDLISMSVFLSVVGDTVGWQVTGIVLLTDDADVFYNAWFRVMGPPGHRLLCTWHVDQAWRKNLSKITGNMELKSTVYQTLRAL